MVVSGEPGPPDRDRVLLKVHAQDDTTLTFRIWIGCPLIKLIQECGRLLTGLPHQTKRLGFLYKGKRLPFEETPLQLGMRDGDVIEF